MRFKKTDLTLRVRLGSKTLPSRSVELINVKLEALILMTSVDSCAMLHHTSRRLNLLLPPKLTQFFAA